MRNCKFLKRHLNILGNLYLCGSIGSVVQLDRISDFGSDGWGFEPLPGHKQNPKCFFAFGVF